MMNPSYDRPRRSAAGLYGLIFTALAWNAHGAVPAFSVNTGTLMTPAAADSWYCAQSPGCSTSGTRQLWTTNYPVEITALARALHNDADNIYEYVRNSIEIVPMYGLQKGALGALIDRSERPVPLSATRTSARSRCCCARTRKCYRRHYEARAPAP